MDQPQGIPQTVGLDALPAATPPTQALNHVEVRKGRLVFELPAANGTPFEASPFCCIIEGPCRFCTCPPPVCVCTQPCGVIVSPPPGQASEVVVLPGVP